MLVDGAPDTKKMIVIVSLFYAMSAVIFVSGTVVSEFSIQCIFSCSTSGISETQMT